MRFLVVLAVGVFLTGCAAQQSQQRDAQIDAMKQARDTGYQRCAEMVGSSLVTVSQVVACREPHTRAFLVSSGLIDDDLVSLYLARERVIADRIDRDDLSFTEASALSSEAYSAMMSEAKTRFMAKQTLDAQQKAANAAAYSAAMQNMQTFQNNRPKSCTTWGSTTTCY